MFSRSRKTNNNIVCLLKIRQIDTNGLLSLTNDILDTSKLELGTLKIENSLFSLDILMEEICQKMESKIQKKS